MDGWLLIGLIVTGAAIATPIAAFVALSRSGRLRRELEDLRNEVLRLRTRIDRQGPQPAAQPAPTPAPAPPPADSAVSPRPLAPSDAPGIDPASVGALPPPPPQPSEPPVVISKRADAGGPTPPPPRSPTPGANSREDAWGSLSDRFERLVAANWLIWLGAAALALGGVFLVRYAWEQGYFGPTARTAAGFAVGAIMVGASEWMRRRVSVDAPGQLHRAPLAVAAAGVLTLYAAVYAAGPLYGLVPGVVALASFVLVSAIAVGLALLHGPLLAVLGFVGGYIAPILTGGDDPAPLLVLGYVFAVTAAALFLVRALNWRSMVWVGLIGSLLWTVISLDWLALPAGPFALALFLVLLVVIATALAWSLANASPIDRVRQAALDPRERTPTLPVDQTVIAAHGFWALAAAALIAALTVVEPPRADPLLAAIAGLLCAGMICGWRKPGFELLPLASLALGVLAPALQSAAPSSGSGIPAGLFLQRLADPTDQIYRFGLMSMGGALVLGIGGWLAMRTLTRKLIMALVSAFGPILILGVAFDRVDGRADPWPWGIAAAFLAALNLLALEGLHRARGGLDTHRLAASIYALAAFGTSLLAVVMLLPPVWLTALVALHLPALALLDRRFNLPILRVLASLSAVLTVARVIWPDQLLAYDIARTPVVNELLVVFGVPILCFWGAARIFASSRRDPNAPLVQALDVGALTLLAGLVSAEIRHIATRGDLEAGFQGLGEAGAYAFAWTGLALGMAARLGASPRLWLKIAERVVLVIAILICVLGVGVIANPLLSGAPQPWALDGPPLLNLIAPSVLGPAVLMAALSWFHGRQSRNVSSQATGFTALALVLLYVTLEVRNAFHVNLSLETGSPVTEAENYAYSLSWLLVAIAALLVGAATRRVAIRHAGMAVLALAVIKVFAFDMASLHGVLRAVSFLGLGVALIAIAFFYQRLVLGRTPKAKPRQS